MKTKKYITLLFFILLIVLYFGIRDDKEEKKDKVDVSYLDVDREVYGYMYDASAVMDYYFRKDPLYNTREITNERNKAKFDKKVKNKLEELLNFPFKESKKNLEVLEEKDKGKYIETRVRILISDFVITDAYLLIPKNVEFPAPAIIAMHQHGGNYEYGKDEPAGNIGNPELFYGMELAERGYIVWITDSSFFGINGGIGGENSPQTAEIFASQGLFVLGHSPIGMIVQEDLISLDYLMNLDIVDKDNIGCIGHSFGGVRCMYLSALDKRVKATVLSNSVASLKFDYRIGEVHTWLLILPGVAKYMEMSGILTLISPRPLMVLYSEKDPIFVKEEAEQQINLISGVYERLNKRDNFLSIQILNKAHEFPLEYHGQAYEFFDKHLKT